MVRTVRNRYIAFRISPPGHYERRDIISAFKACIFPDSKSPVENTKFETEGKQRKGGSERREDASPPTSPWLVILEGNAGIARVPHLRQGLTVKFINSINRLGGKPVKVTTITVSGTIRAARKRAGLAARSRPRDSKDKRVERSPDARKR